jgi:hypothetical protein
MKTRILIAALSAAFMFAAAPVASADPTYAFEGNIEVGSYQKMSPSAPTYSVNATGKGRQTFGDSDAAATKGLDFEVLHHSGISILQLGIWDDNGDGLVTEHWIHLWDLSSPSVPLASVHTLPGTGKLVNGYRYFEIDPVTLTMGTQFVVSVFYPDVVGYNVDSNGNSGTALQNLEPTPTFDSSGYIANIGRGRYILNANAFPSVLDTGPANRYHAGSFAYVPNPEPGTLVLLGSVLAGAGILRRRRRKAKSAA